MLKLLDLETGSHKDRPMVYVTDADKLWARQFLANYLVGDNDLVVGVIPGCGASWGLDARHRRWNIDGFAKVCDALIEKYKAVVIILGDVNEALLGEQLQKGMKHRAIIASGKTTIGDFLGVIKRCDLVITNDGGPLHMAVGVGTKTVSIFGPVDEKIYGPYPVSRQHEVVSRKDLSCRPCYKKFKYNVCDDRKCLDGIKPEDVLAAVDRVLS